MERIVDAPTMSIAAKAIDGLKAPCWSEALSMDGRFKCLAWVWP